MSSSSLPGVAGGSVADRSGSSGGFIVYIVVVISIAALALLGGLVRVCIRKSAVPEVSAGQAPAQTVVSLLQLVLLFRAQL